MSEWKGKYALVTGASYGIGEAFARKLASEGTHLILTARSIERLQSLAYQLQTDYGVNVTVVEADLAQPAAPEQLFNETERRGLQVDLLINNAGFGAVGDFADLPLARQLEMVQVNVSALTALTHLYLQPMIERRRGAIIQVASTAAFQGIPYMALYAATKAFVLSLSEGLWGECREYGVRVVALCPGPTKTHFQEVAGTAHRRNPQKMQTPEEVVEAGLKALTRGRGVTISGFDNRLMVVAERLAPRSLVTNAAAKLFRPFSTRARAASSPPPKSSD
ncbi:MAG TPA: SDR family oxidoreductase [Blastocatellia bacterium]|nr:SDR family oxidoreductase [Blastocatellia bacterium]